MTRLRVMGYPETITAEESREGQTFGSWVVLKIVTREGLEIQLDVSRAQATALIPQLEKAARP